MPSLLTNSKISKIRVWVWASITSVTYPPIHPRPRSNFTNFEVFENYFEFANKGGIARKAVKLGSNSQTITNYYVRSLKICSFDAMRKTASSNIDIKVFESDILRQLLGVRSHPCQLDQLLYDLMSFH
jgi:hypothetical protein